MDKFFQLSQKGSNVRTEIIAGLTTFLTMSYIIFVNPEMLGKTGMDTGAVLVATCIASAIGSLLIGLLANYPFAQAPGMGLNAFFVYTVVMGLGYTWQQGLAIVFLSGLIFILLTITGLRKSIIDAIPANLKFAIAPGIGLFIALIGLKNAGIVNMEGPVLDLGDVNSAPVLLGIIGFVLLTALMVMKVRFAMLWAILGTTLLGIPMGVTQLPDSYSFSEISLSETAFQLDLAGLFTPPEGQSGAGMIFTAILVILSFTLVDLFDTFGTLIGTAAKGDLLDENGNLPRMEKALLADASATLIGSLLGTSTVTTYIESGSGIVAGGRTGLTAVSAAVFFLLAIFLAPVAGIVPAAATSPVLIMVGLLMLESIQKIDLSDLETSVPALLLIIFMPFTYSIANGIAIGMMFYVLVNVFKGNAKSVHPILYILVLLFVLQYVMI
ncbi:MAG: NCS2 family permease [Bacteroidia bacterium]|nr:NCS2 family permease [Bacteroidia bacterium]